MIEGHGDDWMNQHMLKANFSSNVYTHADLRGLREYLMARFHLIGHYPEPEPQSLASLLAERHGISSPNVLVTSGATQAVYLVAQCYTGVRSYIMNQPTFQEYEDACRLYHHEMVESMERADLVWLCTPNNPTGTCLAVEQITDILARMPNHAILILDQSYEDFAPITPLSPHEAVAQKRIISVRSFTKRYAIPGLRIGWVTASDTHISRLHRFVQPWSVNVFSSEAMRYFLTTQMDSLPPIPDLLAEARRLQAELSRLDGLKVSPSLTHFMLCELEHGTAYSLKRYLLENHGMLIRDASNFKGLCAGHFRICAQTPAEDDALLLALKEYLHDN